MLTQRTIDAVLTKLAAAENTNPTPGQVPMPKVLPRTPAVKPAPAPGQVPMPKVLPRTPAVNPTPVVSPPMPKVMPRSPAPKAEAWPRQVYRRGEGRGYRMPETQDGRPVSGGIVLDK